MRIEKTSEYCRNRERPQGKEEWNRTVSGIETDKTHNKCQMEVPHKSMTMARRQPKAEHEQNKPRETKSMMPNKPKKLQTQFGTGFSGTPKTEITKTIILLSIIRSRNEFLCDTVHCED